jgi:ribosomal protein S18 acetylase RimI-like enzyme
VAYDLAVNWGIEPLDRSHIGALARLYADEFYGQLPYLLRYGVAYLTVWERARGGNGVVAVVGGDPVGVVLWQRSPLRPGRAGLVALGSLSVAGLALVQTAWMESLFPWPYAVFSVALAVLVVVAGGMTSLVGIVLGARAGRAPSGSWGVTGFAVDRQFRRDRTPGVSIADELMGAAERVARDSDALVRLTTSDERRAALYQESVGARSLAVVRLGGRTYRLLQAGSPDGAPGGGLVC